MAEVSYDWSGERPVRSGVRSSTRMTPRLARLRQACARHAVMIAHADLRLRAALEEREAEATLEVSSARDPLCGSYTFRVRCA